jgi:hypothetical protein
VLVVVGDQFLDVLDQQRRTGAVSPFGVPTGTDDVGVDVAVSVLGVRDDEP